MKINQNYLALKESYLFSDIAKKVSAFTSAHPEAYFLYALYTEFRRFLS